MLQGTVYYQTENGKRIGERVLRSDEETVMLANGELTIQYDPDKPGDLLQPTMNFGEDTENKKTDDGEIPSPLKSPEMKF